jgi:predicted dehydrogenase
MDAVRRVPGVRIVAICGRDRARAEALAAPEEAVAYTDLDAMLADPRVAAVHNCTINRLHHDVSLAALGAGRHVLSEKPLATDAADSERLVEAAAEAARDGVVSGVCFNYRHYPLVAQIREMLSSGEHGATHFVHGHYLQDWLLLRDDWNWRLQDSDGGSSRAVADIGSHWADLVQHITGDPIVQVLADLSTLHPTRLRPPASSATSTFANGDGAAEGEPVSIASEDFGSVLVRFASGARGAFTLSQTSAGSKNGLVVHLDAATAAFRWDQERPDRAWVGRRSGPNLELVRDPALMDASVAHLARLPAGHPEGWFDALHNLVSDFYAQVRGGASGRLATFADGHARVQFVEAVIASDREQRWLTVGQDSRMAA